MFMLNVLSF
jgi:ABC-type ATPase with predicted acetyltransferase domain